MPGKLVELRNELDAKNKKLLEIFEQSGPDYDMDKVTILDGDSAGKSAQIRAMNDEITDLGKQVDVLAEPERIKALAEERAKASREPVDRPPFPTGKSDDDRPAVKSIAHSLRDSGVFGEMKGRAVDIDFGDVKTLFQTSAGWAPETNRTGRVVDFATRPLEVIGDVIPVGTTGQAAVVYMEETTFTNNAAEVAEGATYGEAALALTERTSNVRKIGVWLPITDEQIEDEPLADGYLNRRLPFMLRQRASLQVLVGDGAGVNLRGILNVAGIQTQAKGADPTPDAIYKAMTKIRVTGQAEPDAVILHPNDWQDIRLLKTVDGIYIWGSPSEAGPERIWGLPVAQAQALTENTGLVGAFQVFCEFAVRRDVEVQVTNSHADYFINGKQAMRADMRAALPVYRPAAFCSVTSI